MPRLHRLRRPGHLRRQPSAAAATARRNAGQRRPSARPPTRDAKQFNGNITTPWLTVGRDARRRPHRRAARLLRGRDRPHRGVRRTLGGTHRRASTRSSATPAPRQSLTATLFDFARGQLGECTTTLTTSAAGTANGDIGTGTVSSGTDTATLTITGTTNWGGTLTWYLCGPVAVDGCDNTKGVQVTSRTVSNSSPATDFVSGTANLTSAGRYCWTAHFEPDAASEAAGVTAQDDNGVGECFTVAPVTPTLTTSATCSANPCVLGDTLSDTATLTGAATGPGTNGGQHATTRRSTRPVHRQRAVRSAGSTYGPDNCTTVAMASTSRTVSGTGRTTTACRPRSATRRWLGRGRIRSLRNTRALAEHERRRPAPHVRTRPTRRRSRSAATPARVSTEVAPERPRGLTGDANLTAR